MCVGVVGVCEGVCGVRELMGHDTSSRPVRVWCVRVCVGVVGCVRGGERILESLKFIVTITATGKID